MLFIYGVGLKGAVDLICADIDHALDAEQAHGFQQIDRAFDIDSERIGRRAHGRRHAHHCGAMDDLVGLAIP